MVVASIFSVFFNFFQIEFLLGPVIKTQNSMVKLQPFPKEALVVTCLQNMSLENKKTMTALYRSPEYQVVKVYNGY